MLIGDLTDHKWVEQPVNATFGNFSYIIDLMY